MEPKPEFVITDKDGHTRNIIAVDVVDALILYTGYGCEVKNVIEVRRTSGWRSSSDDIDG